MTWRKDRFRRSRLMLQIPRLALRRVRNLIEYSGRERFCPVCARYSLKFGAFGIVPRQDAQCVWCGALERHRLIWLFFLRRTDLFANKQPRKMLHVAPETCFESRFRQVIGSGYLSADLFAETVDVKMDICDIGYPPNTFDIIYCSHVLEHVPDDRKAINEFQRVLKQEGWAILLVPITAERTSEDPSVTDPRERLRLFGKEDHVRCYGPDYIDRLRAASFKVSCVSPVDFLSLKEIDQMGITEAAGEIYYCQKCDSTTEAHFASDSTA